jgi:hypothetical protein
MSLVYMSNHDCDACFPNCMRVITFTLFHALEVEFICF